LREAAARAPIDAFFKAFNARDNEALKKTLHYPLVRINEQGGVNVWQTAADAGTNFDALARNEGETFWIATLKDGAWGVQARSSFAP
jgi:hypothetical protein